MKIQPGDLFLPLAFCCLSSSRNSLTLIVVEAFADKGEVFGRLDFFKNAVSLEPELIKGVNERETAAGL